MYLVCPILTWTPALLFWKAFYFSYFLFILNNKKNFFLYLSTYCPNLVKPVYYVLLLKSWSNDLFNSIRLDSVAPIRSFIKQDTKWTLISKQESGFEIGQEFWISWLLWRATVLSATEPPVTIRTPKNVTRV